MHLQCSLNAYRHPGTYSRSHSHVHLSHGAETRQHKMQLALNSKLGLVPSSTQGQVVRSHPYHQHRGHGHGTYYTSAHYQQPPPPPMGLLYMAPVARQLVQYLPPLQSSSFVPDTRQQQQQMFGGDGRSHRWYHGSTVPTTKNQPFDDGGSCGESTVSVSPSSSRSSTPEAEPVGLTPSSAFFQFILSDAFDPEKILYTTSGKTTIASRKMSRYLSLFKKNFAM